MNETKHEQTTDKQKQVDKAVRFFELLIEIWIETKDVENYENQ